MDELLSKMDEIAKMDELFNSINEYLGSCLIKGAVSNEIIKTSPRKAKRMRKGIKSMLWRYFTQWDEENHERFPDIWTKELITKLEKKGWYVRVSYADEIIKPIRTQLLPDIVNHIAWEMTRHICNDAQLQGGERLNIVSPELDTIHLMEHEPFNISYNPISEIVPVANVTRKTIELKSWRYKTVARIEHIENDIIVHLKTARTDSEFWLSFVNVRVEKRFPWRENSV